MKVLITGGDGQLATALKTNANHEIRAPSKEELNITKEFSSEWVEWCDVVLHAAALTRPMALHDQHPFLSIDVNIIGTARISKHCITHEKKLVYISTDYVYPGDSSYFRETDPVLPINNYAWSKLGGECSVKLVPQHLIIRAALFPNDFKHAIAYIDSFKSYLNVDTSALYIWKLIDANATGIYNLGGDRETIYNYASKRVNVQPGVRPRGFPSDVSLDTTKLRKIVDS